jgi:hypothetical protein
VFSAQHGVSRISCIEHQVCKAHTREIRIRQEAGANRSSNAPKPANNNQNMHKMKGYDNHEKRAVCLSQGVHYQIKHKGCAGLFDDAVV